MTCSMMHPLRTPCHAKSGATTIKYKDTFQTNLVLSPTDSLVQVQKLTFRR
jgi:hypothetical protein